MTKDQAVSSIEVDCLCSLQRADMSLPESDDSFPGDQHDTRDRYQMEGVARRLSVQVGAPWGIDRIDTNGEPAVRSWRRPQLWLAHISAQSAPRQPVMALLGTSPPSHPSACPPETGGPIDGEYDDGDLTGMGCFTPRIYRFYPQKRVCTRYDML